MGIRTKIFIPLLLMLAVLSGYMWLVWEPQYLVNEREDYVMHYLIDADLLSKGLSSELVRGRKLEAIGELNKVLDDYSMLFRDVKVVDPSGNMVYHRHGDPVSENSDTEDIKIGLDFPDGEGKLIITVDVNSDLENEKAALRKPVEMLQVVFAITLLGIALLLNQLLRRPLSKLSQATSALAEGDFGANLPDMGKDEIGVLANNFSIMRDAIGNSQRILRNEIEVRKEAELQLEKDVELHRAIDEIMRSSIHETSLEGILQKSVDIIVNISWLPIKDMALIFLSDDDGSELKIGTSRNISEEVIQRCGKIEVGECNCGYVAESRLPMMSREIDACPRISAEGRPGADCIILPIESGKRLLGVVNIYLNDGAGRRGVQSVLSLLVDALAINIERKRSELKLRQQAQLLGQMRDALIGFSNDYLINVWNIGSQKLFGYVVDEVMNKDISLLFPYEEYEGTRLDLLDAVVKHGESELTMLNKGGQKIRAFLSVSQVKDENNIESGWLMHITEVTEMRHMQDELRLLNESLESRIREGTKEVMNQKFALDQHSIVAITDRVGNITYVNGKFCQISGYSRDELVGRKHRILSAEMQAPSVSNEIWKTIEEGKVWHGELKGERKDGSLFWVDTSIVPFMNDNGKPYQYVSIHTDITDRKRIIEEQQNRTQRLNRQQDALLVLTREGVFDVRNILVSLRVIMESAVNALSVNRAGVWLLSDDGTRLQCEALASNSEIVHDRNEPIERENCPEFFNAIETELLIAADDVGVHPGIKGLAEIYLTMRGVRSMLCVPIRVNGKIKGVVNLEHTGNLRHWEADEQQFGIVVTDIVALTMEQVGRREAESRLAVTAQQLRLANRELDKALGEAQKASNVKSEFLATMSHEVRTPMNGIMGMLEMLQDSDLDARDKRYVNIAHNSAKMLLDLLNNVLDFSKIESGGLLLEIIDFAPDKVIEEVVGLMQSLADSKSIGLEIEMDDGLPEKIHGDPMRFRQVLVNLIGNAIKFTSEGYVLVRGEFLQGEGGHEMVRIEVHDTGIGITSDDQARIFEAFAQADGSTTRQYGGTGLGLTISRQLVKLMHGRIGVSSESGKGSVFWFTVPVRAEGSMGRHAAA